MEGGGMVAVDRSGPYPIARVSVPRGKQALINFSDLHVGHPNFREHILDMGIQWALENDALCICGGDWMENATKHSVGAGVVEQVLTPQQQVDFLEAKFSLLKGRFIGGFSGNHEDRTYKETGLDPMQTIARALEIPYFPVEFFGVISAQDENGHNTSYSVYAVHSDSGHKSSGLAVNKVQSDWGWITADIKMKSHDHQLDFDFAETLQVVKASTSVIQRKEYVVLTGSCLSREGSYAAKKPRRPGTLGMLGLWLDMNRGAYKVRPEYLMEG
jgi:hypothetical protein